MYVQHKIEQQGELVWEWLRNKNAFFFIAGSVMDYNVQSPFYLLRPPPPPPASNAKRMPTDVLEAVRGVCIRHGHLSQSQAEQFMKILERERRLQLETWA